MLSSVKIIMLNAKTFSNARFYDYVLTEIEAGTVSRSRSCLKYKLKRFKQARNSLLAFTCQTNNTKTIGLLFEMRENAWLRFILYSGR